MRRLSGNERLVPRYRGDMFPRLYPMTKRIYILTGHGEKPHLRIATDSKISAVQNAIQAIITWIEY